MSTYRSFVIQSMMSEKLLSPESKFPKEAGFNDISGMLKSKSFSTQPGRSLPRFLKVLETGQLLRVTGEGETYVIQTAFKVKNLNLQ